MWSTRRFCPQSRTRIRRPKTATGRRSIGRVKANTHDRWTTRCLVRGACAIGACWRGHGLTKSTRRRRSGRVLEPRSHRAQMRHAPHEERDAPQFYRFTCANTNTLVREPIHVQHTCLQSTCCGATYMIAGGKETPNTYVCVFIIYICDRKPVHGKKRTCGER